MSETNIYTTSEAAGAVIVEGAGVVHPDTHENRKLGRTTQCELTGEQAQRFGDRLVKVGKAKQTEATKTKPAEATKTK